MSTVGASITRLAMTSFIVLGSSVPVSVLAEDAPLSYKADPSVYKLLAENDQFRVILATRNPGQRDAWHSHAGAQTVYALSDCSTGVHTPDGNGSYRDTKAGDVTFGAPIVSHSAENRGKAPCRQLIVEKK